MKADGKQITGVTLNFDHEVYGFNNYFCNIVMSVSVKSFYLLFL